MIKLLYTSTCVIAILANTSVFAQSAGISPNGGPPGGTSGQTQYNNSGAFGGFTLGGDCTLAIPNITCSNGSNPFQIGGSNKYIEFGSGPPSSSAHGAGSLYYDTTNFIGYIYEGSQVQPTWVQGAVNTTGNFAITLGATPTVGNYLIAECGSGGGFTGGVLPGANTGFTSFGSVEPAAGNHVLLVYHKVVGGDGTSWTPCTGGVVSSSTIKGAMIEVSGLSSSNFSSNLQQINNAGAGPSSSPTAISSATTTTGNTLNLAFGFTHGGTHGFISNSGSSTTWINTASNAEDSSVNGVFIGTHSDTNNAASLGLTIVGQNVGGSVSTSIIVTLQPSNVQTTGWQPFSFLTTLKNGGVNITINARTFNCSIGTLCTDDGAGNTTLTAAIVGTSASVGGGSVASGACTSGTATVTGVTSGEEITATPVTYPGDGFVWEAYMSASNTATVKVCNFTSGALTPTASVYNVRVHY